MDTRSSKSPTRVGNDVALEVTSPNGGRLAVSFWDLWFAMIAARDCGGDLNLLAAQLSQGNAYLSCNRESAERKHSHLRDMQRRLLAAGVSAAELVATAGDLVRREGRRARSRVLGGAGPEREWSEAMRNTPRQRRRQQALRGFWPRFPISPQADADQIASGFRTRNFFTAEQSFGLARRVDRFVTRAEELLASHKYAEAQALLRAALTAVIDLIGVADDSYGSIGESFQRGFALYLDIPLAPTKISDEVFFADLLSLLIWEDYGLTWKRTEGYFGRRNAEQAQWCINYLRMETDGLRADALDYQAEAALTLLGQIASEQRRFDLFESLAAEMGSRAWNRIVRLVDRAMTGGKQILARRVLEAALTPGPHHEFLAGKLEQLKRGKWNPDPKR